MCTMNMPERSEEDIRSSETVTVGRSGAAMWVLGITSESFARAAIAFNQGAQDPRFSMNARKVSSTKVLLLGLDKVPRLAAHFERTMSPD